MIQEKAPQIQVYEAPARLFKLLALPARLAILHILRDGEHCVCHMEAHLGYRQAYISQQVAALREAGIIEDRRDGWNIYYRIADTRIFSVLDTVQIIMGQPTIAKPHEDVVCNCPHCRIEKA